MRRQLSLLVLAFAAGCTVPECTLVACANGLTVGFAQQPAAPFRVEARLVGGTDVRVYDCADITTCSKQAFFNGYLPGDVSITVTYQGRTSTTQVHPQYSEIQPGRSDCQPACVHAIVAVPLP